MSGKTVCRFCEIQTSNQEQQIAKSQLAQLGAGGRRPFAITGAMPHYAPDRPFQLDHIFLDLKVDPKAKSLEGIVTHRLRVVDANQRYLNFDQIGLQISEVKAGNQKLPFHVEGNSLMIGLEPILSQLKVGDLLEVSVQYRAPHPRRGIYFTGPDSDYPKKPYQVWTQGQDEDSRYWFPTLDYPNQKATSEMRVVVPPGFTAVSNGALLARDKDPAGTRFHYKLGVPQVTYLTTLVVAEFSEWSEPGPRNIPVQYFVQKGREEDGKRAFGNTPKMIEVFEKMTGIPYPYEKYSQAAVQDFIFGGMENTSATTQTDLTLHDSRTHLDFSSDPLVSHELAHQWFGDLLTCRDWSHGWLNEGFATFMERVWVENNPGPNGGPEEAKYYSYQDLKEHFAEDSGKYRRPIVCNTYIEPIDLFDTHLYQKGGLVLNLLRYVLGEDSFWKSVQLYLNRHRGKNVETIDLIRAIEDTTGRNLRRFFDEWIFNAGYPEFEVSYQWHEDKKLTEWVIEQKQTGGAPFQDKDGARTLLFHLPVVLELTLDNGQKMSHRIEVGEARERVFLPAPSKPVMVRFDPGFFIPKTLKFPRSKEMLLYQLKNDSDCMGRIEAAQELGKIVDQEVIEALGKAALQDPFWGVQVETAKVLGEIRMDAARDALIAALAAKHPKGRRGIVNALGTFQDSNAAESLKRLAEKDESYFVEADATSAWASASSKPFQWGVDPESQAIEKFLLNQLAKPSYREVIRNATLNALADLPGIGSGERPQALQALIAASRRGSETDARVAAVRALGKVLKVARAPEKAKILDVLSRLSDEDNFRLRVQLVATFEGSGCSEAIPILSRIRQIELDGRVRRSAQLAIDTLMTSSGVPDSVANLKSALEKLEEETKKLRSMVEARPLAAAKS